MSRLRRLLVSGKMFFVTCCLARGCANLGDAELDILARAVARVRERRRFLLSGYVFMPDHWHALIAPAARDELPQVMNALKVAAAHDINRHRRVMGQVWQRRYYEHIVGHVREYRDVVR